MKRFILLFIVFGFVSACSHFESREAVRIVSVEPVYPEAARLDRIEGRVIIEYVITKEGRPVDLRIVESTPPGVFDDAARKAVSAWRYEPALRYGKPVASPEAEAVLVFELNDPPR